MKQSREDLRKVTFRYRYNAETGQTTLVIDVESPSEDLPHEHKRDMREMAEELLGIPLSELPEEIEVNLRAKHAHPHPHPHPPEEDHQHERNKEKA
jgi:hypothetical protein